MRVGDVPVSDVPDSGPGNSPDGWGDSPDVRTGELFRSLRTAAPHVGPSARALMLVRRPEQFTALNPDNPGYSELSPLLSSPRYTGAQKLTIWNDAVFDYHGSRPRNELIATGVPKLKGVSQTGSIILSAPYERPVPYFAWVTVFMRPTPGALGTPAYREARVGVVRHFPDRPTVNYRVVCEHLERKMTYQENYYNPLAFGFDVVPPGQTYEISAGWGVPDLNYRLRLFDWGVGDPEQCRFHFGVVSLLPV